MQKDKQLQVSVKEIMAKIKNGLNGNKNDDYSSFHKWSIENELAEFCSESEKQNIRRNEETFIDEKRTYEYGDFEKYNDKEFIRNVYRGLLQREPDSGGYFWYLENLRNGKKSKKEIITLIRYSGEGREKNIQLLGSKKRAVFYFLKHLFLRK
ncbi:MAG TPA: hypothetical protein DHM44_03795 [Flexistipes sinusarabici]|uniref:DUF4214 domain-containing protein n=1 Tax=Flexistipes sinusarabici TaxID=2352 RepID=A0A3D5QAA6_FLESI|nr:hypothetical protein [Flexistipes sinusarabici]